MAINKTTLQQILDTVQELHNLEQIVTREAVREATGLALTTVDDRLATLVIHEPIGATLGAAVLT